MGNEADQVYSGNIIIKNSSNNTINNIFVGYMSNQLSISGFTTKGPVGPINPGGTFTFTSSFTMSANVPGSNYWFITYTDNNGELRVGCTQFDPVVANGGTIPGAPLSLTFTLTWLGDGNFQISVSDSLGTDYETSNEIGVEQTELSSIPSSNQTTGERR